jgi:MoaA/NifB/PqqE/SkfB family radical SAM enzyme
VSWQQDERYTSIRHSMLQGEKLPHCENCYQQQAQGLISDRHTETLEWTNRLGLRHIDDLTDLQAPAYIEVRPNNRCNLMCRMCNPHSSHRIAKEYKQLGLVRTVSSTPASDAFSGIDLAALKKLYVSGGEPLINPEFVQWLDQSRGQVSAQTEIMINTNGTRLPMRLRKLLPDWPNLQFIFSIDAFGSLNDYIRWPSSWHTILDHWRYLREAGHRVHVNTTVSIYNIHRLSELFEFIDQTWPDTLLHLNLVQDPDHISFQTFPDRDLAQKDLGRAQQCQVVKNNRLAGDTLRYLSKQMHLEHDRSHLERFFDFNDRLDQSRGTQLGFYDKILDSYRK